MLGNLLLKSLLRIVYITHTIIAPITSIFPRNLDEEKSSFPFTLITRYTPVIETKTQIIIFKDTFILYKKASEIKVNTGTEATIIEALDADVN